MPYKEVNSPEPPVAKEWEIPLSGTEQVKDPKAISENVSEVFVPVVAENYDAAKVPTASNPGISECNQPDSSPYSCDAATILIGRSRKRYVVPINIVGRAPSLQWHQDALKSLIVRLPEVDDDVGHTLIHYLYTGDYETLKQSPKSDMPRHAMEYRRGILAYHAALACGLSGLADHARKYIQTFDTDIPIFDIIALGRKTFPRITEDTWFSEYLSDKIMASFEADEGIFQQEEFFNGFGEALDFDKYLGKVMAKTYAHKMSSIRYATGLKSMDNRSTMATMTPGESAADNKYDSISKVRESYNEKYAETQPNDSQKSASELAPSTGDYSWLNCEENEYTEVGSSLVRILTPSSSTGEASDEKYIEETSIREADSQSDSDLGRGICPHWQQHSTHENLWKSCPRCKSYILNMFAGLLNFQN